VTGPPDEPLPVVEPLVVLELEDAQAARRTVAAQATADLLIVEAFTLVLLCPMRAVRGAPAQLQCPGLGLA